MPPSLCYPTANDLVRATREVYAVEPRRWDQSDTWRALRDDRAEPAVLVLHDYSVEVAKWGSLYRWVSNDCDKAAKALRKIRLNLIPLEDRAAQYTEEEGEEVIDLWVSLLQAFESQGVAKSQFSWASKLLHWLLPDRVPIYDSHVLRQLGITSTGAPAYRRIVAWQYECAQFLRPHHERICSEEPGQTVLGAIDNYLWLRGRER